MAALKFIYGTEAQILALTPESPNWVDRAFYYPEDKEYFFQAVSGVMKKYGSGQGSGVGIRLNGDLLGGIKTLIEMNDILTIPGNYDYNTYQLDIQGSIECNGQINMM